MKKLMTRAVAALAVVATVLGTCTVASAQGSLFTLTPDRYQTFTAFVYQGVPTRVEVRGFRVQGADLDLVVRDAYGNMVAIDNDSSNYCVGVWVPEFTGMVTIYVANNGWATNRYSLHIWGGYFR